MSLILDALKKARQIAQGRDAAPEAQALMKNFGVSQRSRRRQMRKNLLMYIVPAAVLAIGIAIAANYWLGRQAKSAMTVSRPLEPAATAAAPPNNPEPAPPAETPRPAQAAPPAVVVTMPTSPPPRPAPQAPPPNPAPAHSAPAAVVTEEKPPIVAERRGPTPEVVVPPVVTPPAPRPTAPAAPEGPERDPFDAMRDFYNIGNYPRALEECRKALIRRPEDASTHLNCGAVLIKLNNLAEAIAELNRAIAIDRNNDKAFLNLGTVYMAQGDNISADGAFERTIELNPNNAGAYRNRGIIAKRSGKPEVAKNFFLEATRRDSKDIAAHYDIAVIYDEQGETGKAVEYFRKFRDLAKGLPDWRAEVSHAVSRLEELEKRLPRL